VDAGAEFEKWKGQLANESPDVHRLAADLVVLYNLYPMDYWSSWKQDGSREGVYAQTFDADLNKLSFETQVNEYTESYQWEPDFVVLSSEEIIGVWSSWGDLDKDYEIVARKVMPKYLIGMIDSSSYQHIAGTSTSNFYVHVVDSNQLTGHTYEITFGDFDSKNLDFSVQDKNTSEFKVIEYPLNLGSNVQYMTDEFDGIMVEIIPNFNLKLDFYNSRFINNSGTNIQFTLEDPVIYASVAPLDVAVVWGSADTLSDGRFAVPLDTALSSSAVREIELPFIAQTLEENEKLGVVVFENVLTKNNRWDPGENIAFLTPEGYKTNDFSTHAQLLSSVDSENIIWPDEGDTNYIITLKPITIEDIYSFTTFKEDIVLDLESKIIPKKIMLYQNYPNPFNPSTTINYQIPAYSLVTLKVYDVLGSEVVTLVNSEKSAGNYEIEFDASNLSSGVYFYQLKAANPSTGSGQSFVETKKMVFMK